MFIVGNPDNTEEKKEENEMLTLRSHSSQILICMLNWTKDVLNYILLFSLDTILQLLCHVPNHVPKAPVSLKKNSQEVKRSFHLNLGSTGQSLRFLRIVRRGAK